MALLLGLLACGSGTGPSGHAVPPLGTYAFHMQFVDATQLGPIALTYDGTLTLTGASSDSLVGYWTVPGLQTFAGALGPWNVDAYAISAIVQSGGRVFVARVTRTSGGMACDGLLVDAYGPVLSKPALCTLTGP